MADPQPRVAIIVVAWNNEDILPGALDSVREQTYPFVDTYVIDNDSKDSTAALVARNYPEVVLIHGGSNLGFARGNNVAIEYALTRRSDYRYLVFLNSDARLRADWVERMVAFAEGKPTGALFQSVTLDYFDPQIIDSTHVYVSTSGQGTQGNWRSPYLGPVGPMRVFGVNAAAAMISRAFVEAQPLDMLFDERMFMYLEDVDLSARATVLGWDNYLVPDTEAYHMGSASSGKNPGFSLYMTFRNNTAMLLKNYPAAVLVRMLPRVLLGDVRTVKHLVRQDRSRAAWKVVQGRAVGILRAPLYRGDRRRMAAARTIDPQYLTALMRKGFI